MSADNGVYILRTTTTQKGVFEYRVTYAQAIENIYFNKLGSKKWASVVKDYFGNSMVYSTREGAWEKAGKVYDAIVNGGDICEYGIEEIHVNRRYPL